MSCEGTSVQFTGEVTTTVVTPLAVAQISNGDVTVVIDDSITAKIINSEIKVDYGCD